MQDWSILKKISEKGISGYKVSAEDRDAIQTIRARITDAEVKLTGLKEEETQKKMIACHLFKRIELGRDYKISVELNMSYQRFCFKWGNGSILITAATV